MFNAPKRTKDLMLAAAVEIDDLRRLLGEAQRYRVHTERMLALFEGGPPHLADQCMGEDIAFALRRAVEQGDGCTQSPDRKLDDKLEAALSDEDVGV